MTTHAPPRPSSAIVGLPDAQAGDVRVETAAGGDVTINGLSAEQLLPLIAAGVQSLNRLTIAVTVQAVLSAVLFVAAALLLVVLLQPHQIAGELDILKNLISVRF